MSWILRTVFIAAALLTVACDPGMTIRQVKSPDETLNRSATAAPLVVVRIKLMRILIGSKLYIPEVKVTNSSRSPITITHVELTANSKTYENKPPRPEAYPLTIAPGGTETLEVLFRLDDDVHETFRQSAELCVHYRIGEKDQLARASVIGGHLEDAP